MPLYEFVCQKCGHLFEFLAKSHSQHIEVRCRACGSEELTRVLSRPHIAVKGCGERSSAGAPGVENRSCPSGSCTTITLPGYSR